ncbi:alpha/beta fold hydrolase [Candidatus Woesearchaeota archaeon]|nr:alpha/beta fold hydrolase [Candidatus Woesearchaeota archaeon]
MRLKPFLLIGSILIIIIFFGLNLFVLIDASRLAHLSAPPTLKPLREMESLTLHTDDGVELSAWHLSHPSSKASILLLHGWGKNKEQMLRYANFLYAHNYSILVMDFRGFGESSGKTTLGDKEAKDVAAAVSFLRSKGEKHIGVLGISMGAAAAIRYSAIAPASDHGINALVVDSVYTSLYDTIIHRYQSSHGLLIYPYATLLVFWGGVLNDFNGFALQPVKDIEQVHTPLLIIHGGVDPKVSVEEAQDVYRHANKPKELWIVPNAEHANIYDLNKEAYEQKVLEFFDATLA